MTAPAHAPLHETLDAYNCGVRARKQAMMARHHLAEALRIMRHVRLAGSRGVRIARPDFSEGKAALHIWEYKWWRFDFHQMLRGNRDNPGFMDGYRGAGR